MKSPSLILGLLLANPLMAIEYVTLTGSTTTRALQATDIVEVVGTNKNNDGNSEHLNLTFADGASTKLLLRGKEGSAFTDMRGNIFTGLTSISLTETNGSSAATNTCVTLKITPESEVGSTPGTVLVIPENSTGDFDVIIESSDDLINWTTLHTETVDAQTDSQFYRARIIKTIAP